MSEQHAAEHEATMLDWALPYARAGYHVFPIHTIRNGACSCGGIKRCKPGKHPVGTLVPNGLKDATTDPEVIKVWWSKMPDANIGIATGRESNLVVLDVDGAEGEALLAELERQYGPLPPTAVVKTGKGRHLHFAYPKGVTKVRTVARKKLKLDVRGDGGYVVAPPSIHESGHTYIFTKSDVNALPECPAWVVPFANGELEAQAPIVPTPPFGTPPTYLTERKRHAIGTICTNVAPPPWTQAEENRLRSALAFISATERDVWLHVGMALHWTKWGEPAFRIWDDWSRTVPEQYDEADQHKTWESFKRPYNGQRITLATIFHIASQYGWSDETRPINNPSAQTDPQSDDAEISRLAKLPPLAYERERKDDEKRGAAQSGAAPLTPRAIWHQNTFSAAELQTQRFEPVRYVVPQYVPEGVALLIGRPKIGKSWLALDLAVACASGGNVLGSLKPVHGDVLYLALEDGKRRLQRRLDKLSSPVSTTWPKRLSMVQTGDWRRADQGGLEDIDAWCASASKPALVVIDTLARFRKPTDGKQLLYAADTDAIAGLQKIAVEHGLAIMVVHHDRKAEADDPFDTVSGTFGLTGAADTILILKRRPNGVVLYARGRDIEESETAMQFDKGTCRWNILGAASEVFRSNERARVISALKAAGQPLSVREIMADAEMQNRNAADILLGKMARDGEIVRVGRGRYDLSAKINGQIGQKER